MKKALMLFGAFCLFSLLLVGAFVSYMTMIGTELDKESEAYVMKTVPEICAEFDAEAFLKLASPELAKSIPKEDIARLFDWYSTLGAFRRVVDIKGESNVSISNWDSKSITARFAVRAEFESGPANLSLLLVKRDGEWKYVLFLIVAPALMSQ